MWIDASYYENDGETTVFGQIDLTALIRHYGLTPTPAWDLCTVKRADKTYMHAAIAVDIAGEPLLANVFWTAIFDDKTCDPDWTEPDYTLEADDLGFYASFYPPALCDPHSHLDGKYLAWQEQKERTPLLTDLIPLLACLTDCITGGAALDTCFAETARIDWPETAEKEKPRDYSRCPAAHLPLRDAVPRPRHPSRLFR